MASDPLVHSQMTPGSSKLTKEHRLHGSLPSLPQHLTSRCEPTPKSGIPTRSTSFVQNTLGVSIRGKAVHFAKVEKKKTKKTGWGAG